MTHAQRLLVLAGVATVSILAVGTRLFNLQIAQSETWAEDLNKRNTLNEPIRGRRGEILDARGEVLASDLPGYDLMVVTAGRAGVLYRCTNCDHDMHVVPPSGKSAKNQAAEDALWTKETVPTPIPEPSLAAMNKREHKAYTRCPRCRKSGANLFVQRDRRDLRPLARVLNKDVRWIQNRLAVLHGRNDWRVKRAMQDYPQLTEGRRRKRRAAFRREMGWQELRLRRDVTYDTAREVTLHPDRNPGFRIHETPVRRNLGGTAFVHLVGIPADPYERANSRATGMGLERTYDHALRGEAGYVRRIRNPERPNEFVIAERRQPIAGVDVQLTIARRDQEAALAALGRRIGALVVVNAETGAVLVLASSPTYKPEEIGKIFSYVSERSRLRAEAKVAEKAGNKSKADRLRGRAQTIRRQRRIDPTVNRAVRGFYPPGSTMKPFTAIAAVQQGAVTLDEMIECRKIFSIGDKPFGHSLRCNSTHGLTNLRRALVESCNVYFQTAMHRMYSTGTEPEFRASSHRFGFGRATGLAMEPKWVNSATFVLHPTRRTKGQRVQYGTKLQAAIGQGLVTATPAQIARAYAGLLTGHVPDLHVVARIGSQLSPQHRTSVEVAPGLLDEIRTALRANNDPGTSLARAGLDRWELGVKTGTAQVGERGSGEHTTWIAGFADEQCNRPAIAFAIVLERSMGSAGSECSGPLSQFFERFYGGNRRE